MPSTPDYAGSPSIITGADGFIGRHLVALFKAQGWPTLPLTRRDTDLTDRPRVLDIFKNLPKAGRVFHFATYQRTGQIQYKMAADLMQVNTHMHLNVLEAWAAHQPQAKLVAVGSSCAYPVMNDPIPETALHSGPLHDSVKGYGLAKQALIIGAQNYASQYGLKALTPVFATVYGPHDHLEAERSHFIGGMMARALTDQAAGKKEMLVYGTPQTSRECLYVTDQIDAMLAADGAFDGGLLNTAANQPITLQEMAETIQKVIGWTAPIVFPQGSYTGADKKQLDSGRFLAATGWKPKTGLESGLKRLADDLRGRLGIH
jgi:GDP-L-fucose synthase